MTEHLDVLVVGAGISGIAAAYHLQTDCPGKRYAILERRESIGGTWDLFRYPGIRSDSDMYTFGFPFRPWMEDEGIAAGDKILRYLKDTAAEFGIDRHIHYGVSVERASWSSEDATWTVQATRDGAPVTYTCNFLFMCAGYYRYAEGHTPEFPGRERFEGTVIHPQHWPEDLDYRGKKVVVIGSGATAVTIVPNMADEADGVTMLQRSPTYFYIAPAIDPVIDAAKKVLPAQAAFLLGRWKYILLGTALYQFCRRYPETARRLLMKGVRSALEGTDVDVDTHFNPHYTPWEQRLCLVPDADFFETIKEGKVDVVTDHIETFTEKGIALKSGRELEADIIVTATGLKIQFLGGVPITVDGRAIDPSELLVYRAAMYGDVPNLASIFGYTNASWTLKADLICGYVCRVLNAMDEKGANVVVPRVRDEKPAAPFLEDFSAGYIQRDVDRFPKQGAAPPWRVFQNYLKDLFLLGTTDVADGTLEFSHRTPAPKRRKAADTAAAPAE
jgi:monooxygenase